MTWIRKYWLGILIEALVVIVIIVLGLLWFVSINQEVARIEKKPRTKTISIFVGRNLSTNATSITGSTIHMSYENFQEYSKKSRETFLIIGKRAGTGNPCIICPDLTIFSAYANTEPYTYQTRLPISVPYYYRLAKTTVEPKMGILTITCRLLDAKYRTRIAYLLLFMIGVPIFMTIMIVFVCKDYAKTEKYHP